MAEIRCPDCGSNKIGKGKLEGYAALIPVGKFFTTGSTILADVCTECGTINRMKAEKPEKFINTIDACHQLITSQHLETQPSMKINHFRVNLLAAIYSWPGYQHVCNKLIRLTGIAG